MQRIAGWWDGFEMWVAGLPFVPQFLVVLAGMVPISLILAYALDRLLRWIFDRLGRGRFARFNREPTPESGIGVPGPADTDPAPTHLDHPVAPNGAH